MPHYWIKGILLDDLKAALRVITEERGETVVNIYDYGGEWSISTLAPAPKTGRPAGLQTR